MSKEDMKYNVDSIDLTEEELIECIKSKNYDAIIRSFAKVISKYTKDYDDDLRQELYVILIEKCNSENIRSWKNYLYGVIKKHAKMWKKYKYKFCNLTRRETDTYIKLKYKHDIKSKMTDEELFEFDKLQKKQEGCIPLHLYETTNCISDVNGNSYEMQYREKDLVDEIKKVLTNKEFEIFYMRSVMNDSLRDIASKVGMTHENVSLILKKCTDKLKNSKNIQEFM